VEYEHHESRVFTFLAGVMFGAALGAGVALLTAPERGRKTRKKLARAAYDARDSAQERLEDLADDVRGRVDGAVKVARKRISR